MPRKRKPQASHRRRRHRIRSRSRRATPKARLVPVSTPSERIVSARDRSLHALADMRHGASISQAARNNGVTTRTIKKYVGSALLQDRPGGRTRPTKSDRFVRYLQIPGLHDPIEIKARGSAEAKEVAKYKAWTNRVLRGDLKTPWRGKKKIAGVKLITEWQVLKDLAQRDLLPYSLYRSLSGGAP